MEQNAAAASAQSFAVFQATIVSLGSQQALSISTCTSHCGDICVTNKSHLDDECCARLYLVLEVLRRLSLLAAMASPGVSG